MDACQDGQSILSALSGPGCLLCCLVGLTYGLHALRSGSKHKGCRHMRDVHDIARITDTSDIRHQALCSILELSV